MTIGTETLVSMRDANQNFSKVTRLVDEKGIAVILKNNKPRYAVIDFEAYDEFRAAQSSRQQQVEKAADQLIAENLEAFQELAK